MSKTLPSKFSHHCYPEYDHKELPFIEEDYLQPMSKAVNYADLDLHSETQVESAGMLYTHAYIIMYT